MKQIMVLLGTLFLSVTILAQKETFDLATYTSPKAWKKQLTESAVLFSTEDAAKGNYCLITLYKSVPGTTNPKDNFDMAWASLVKEMVTVSSAPEMQPASTENGWEIQSGYAPFEKDGNKGIVMLVTASSLDKMVNLIIVTNTNVYEKEMTAFIGSLSLKKLGANTQSTTAAGTNNLPVVGTWGKNGSVNPDYHDVYATSIAGYTSDQYTFNSNGTYYFISKTFGMAQPKMFLIKESGNYLVSGNNITIIPQKSVLEAWSKKESVDNTGRLSSGDTWGKLLSSQKRTLEKVTYQFTKHYFSGIQLWNLVLQSNSVTKRDGPHSSNTAFTNAWYYSPISANNPVIELPGGQKNISEEEVEQEAVQQTATVNNTALVGTWCISASDQSNYRVQNGVVSTIFRQYTFNANGNYTCNIKTFDPLLNSIFLGREHGTYQTSGNNLMINPQKSVLEEWSKKGGRDEWGSLLTTQSITPEKITYQFTKQYIAEINEWQLILKTGKETKRDGPFNNYDRNAWIYIITSAARPVIKLPN